MKSSIAWCWFQRCIWRHTFSESTIPVWWKLIKGSWRTSGFQITWVFYCLCLVQEVGHHFFIRRSTSTVLTNIDIAQSPSPAYTPIIVTLSVIDLLVRCCSRPGPPAWRPPIICGPHINFLLVPRVPKSCKLLRTSHLFLLIGVFSWSLKTICNALYWPLSTKFANFILHSAFLYTLMYLVD